MGSSSSSRNESANTTNTTNNSYDQRQLDYSNHSSNSVDLSNRSTTNFDGSNRSTNTTNFDGSNRSTTNASFDSSNRSTNNIDNSNRSSLDMSNRSTSTFTQNTTVDTSNRSTNNITTTDLGAISGALAVAKDSINSNAAGFNQLVNRAAEMNKDSLDFGVRMSNSAFEAIGQNQHITDDLVKNAQDLAKYTSGSIAEIAAKAGSQVSDAWKNAKDAQDGKSLGDMKPIAIAVIGVFALMALKKG